MYQSVAMAMAKARLWLHCQFDECMLCIVYTVGSRVCLLKTLTACASCCILALSLVYSVPGMDLLHNTARIVLHIVLHTVVCTHNGQKEFPCTAKLQLKSLCTGVTLPFPQHDVVVLYLYIETPSAITY